MFPPALDLVVIGETKWCAIYNSKHVVYKKRTAWLQAVICTGRMCAGDSDASTVNGECHKHESQVDVSQMHF